MQPVRCGESAQTVKARPYCGRFPPAAYSTPEESLYSSDVEQAFLIHLRLFRDRTLETLSGDNDYAGGIKRRNRSKCTYFATRPELSF